MDNLRPRRKAMVREGRRVDRGRRTVRVEAVSILGFITNVIATMQRHKLKHALFIVCIYICTQFNAMHKYLCYGLYYSDKHIHQTGHVHNLTSHHMVREIIRKNSRQMKFRARCRIHFLTCIEIIECKIFQKNQLFGALCFN